MKLALLGCGTVGSEVVRQLHDQSRELAARVGERIELAGVAVRRLDRDRGDLLVDPGLFTANAHELVTRDDIDIVVEVVGGTDPAREWILAALRAGKSVVTANKVLMATDGAALHRAATHHGAQLYYEAAVAGAIPLLRPLRESLHGDVITSVMGIVNGTTNYVLSRMTETGAGFAEALAEAGELGYAEADPTADIEGFDAASKAAILASLAFHTQVSVDDVYREGITDVTAGDVASAAEIGCVVKPLCIATRDGDKVSARVHAAMIPKSHPLAGVNGAYNAVFVEAQLAGRLMFYGAGAGGAPTASAILGDLVTVARMRRTGRDGGNESGSGPAEVLPMGETQTRYHLSLDVTDEPGVLAQVATVFARNDVSMRTVRQSGRGNEAILVAVTHIARDAQLARTVRELEDLPSVRRVDSVMRVEGES